MPRGNSFDIETGEIVCTGAFACLHEHGHALDKSLGWPSNYDNWKMAVDVYRRVAWECVVCRDKMSYDIEFFPGIGAPYLPDNNPLDLAFWKGGWGGYTELYASIYAWVSGDRSAIPNGLRPFYMEVTSD